MKQIVIYQLNARKKKQKLLFIYLKQNITLLIWKWVVQGPPFLVVSHPSYLEKNAANIVQVHDIKR